MQPNLEAYDLFPVVERLPRQIESISSYGENLIVGTKEGQLLVYAIQQKSDTKFESFLNRSIKTFSKKPVLLIEAVQEYHFMLSLSDSIVSVHDMAVFAPICVIEKTRGANYFVTDLQKSKSDDYDLKLCVIVKKKLLFFHWINRDFIEYRADILLPDYAKMVAWSGEHIFVAFRKDYSVYSLADGTFEELFSVGRQLEPFVLRCGDLVALSRDETSVLVAETGATQQKLLTMWNISPFAIAYDDPYLLALNQNGVEIRSFDPKLFIQQYELAKAKKICITRQKKIYIASSTNIWRLQRRSNISQIKQLLENKQFELALTLTKSTEESNEEKISRQEEIRNLCAFELFAQHQFAQALDIFAQLRTDPCHVVGLYPDLLPNVFRKQLQFPRKPPHLEGHDLEQSLICLVEYLKLKRNEIMKDSSHSDISTITMVDGKVVMRSSEQLAQIIDTTLLKCYLQTNDAFVSYFLRLRDNSCYLKETERLLKLHHKILDLITLYKSRGMHQKAFEVILQQLQRSQLSIDWEKYAIEYLQELDVVNANIIFEYSEWLLKKNPKEAIQIFTGDTEESKNLPRNEVALFLRKISNDLLIIYLEHAIKEWKEDSAYIHDMLVESYLTSIQPLLLEYTENLPPGLRPVVGGMETGNLGILRKKCIAFLEESKFYSPEIVLKMLPSYLFFEEKAILHSKCGNHNNSIIILIYILQDDDAAERYCCKVHNEMANSQVFYLLFKAYLSQPEFKFLADGPPAKYSPFPNSNFQKAIEILRKYIMFINPKNAIPMLPQAILLQSLLDIFETIFAKQAASKHQSLILRHLYESQHLKMKHKNYTTNIKCTINKEDLCDACLKKIANSAFVRNINGTIVHCFCHKQS